jgi:hypothetical protein
VSTTTCPALADVLAEVNRLRAEHGLRRLSEMPKGSPDIAHACPVANALSNGFKVRVYPPSELGERGWYGVGPTMGKLLPQVLADFARAFDDGAYPDLVKPFPLEASS